MSNKANEGGEKEFERCRVEGCTERGFHYDPRYRHFFCGPHYAIIQEKRQKYNQNFYVNKKAKNNMSDTPPATHHLKMEVEHLSFQKEH